MNKTVQGDVSQQAALYLKVVVNENWSLGETNPAASDSQKPFQINNKENLGSLNHQKRQQTISQVDRDMLKTEIFGALDSVVNMVNHPGGKVLVSSLENIIWNIAQLDYASWA